jgi:aarF domain-containing kinase
MLFNILRHFTRSTFFQDGKMQLVLLDHGLYKELDQTFRLEYAGLWRSLILADEKGIRKHCESMNAGDGVQLFTMMLTQRPWEQVGFLQRIFTSYNQT